MLKLREAGGAGGLALAIVTCAPSAALAGTSGSDACAEAPVVGPGVYSGSTSAADSDGSACSFSQDSPDVWFRFTADDAGTLTASTCGSGFDTVLSLHEACPGGPDNQIECNDDACGFQSSVTTELADGGSVLVRVSGYNGSNGAYDLEISYESAPAAEDLNGNGVVDFGDILMVIGAWGPCTGCPEDLDHSGAVGFGDVLMVIGAWG
ncbi:MAG: hypothetical protein ACYTGP_04455 [Planctomycetota bacterium]|jgi:hypothetical protein